jgi:hypothetical protein
MEVILPRMADVFRRDYLRKISEMRDFHVRYPFLEGIASYVTEGLFNYALDKLERIALKHPLYQPSTRLPEIAAHTDPIMHRTFTSGEGWLIPGEILHYASKGVKAFVVLQPFGCLPNHICGRGVMKRLKEEYPRHPDPSPRLRSGYQLRQHRESPPDADHEHPTGRTARESYPPGVPWLHPHKLRGTKENVTPAR